MRKKVMVVFCTIMFVFAMGNISTAEEVEKKDERIVLELIPGNRPAYDTGIYSDPEVVITEPEDGDVIGIPYLEVVGYATDSDGLDYIHWKWEWAHGTYTNESDLDVATSYSFRLRIYNLPEGWHKVTVTLCDTLDNCNSDNVTVTYVENEPPTKPGRPYGPDRGIVDSEYTFSTHSTDPEEDTIRYGWDWDGDNVVDEWTDYYPSGETIYASHSWSFTGTYPIKVMAEDENGGQSALSLPLAIVIHDNSPPAKPETPTGSTIGAPGISYTYSTSTVDPNGDRVYYMFDWDDDTELEWEGPYNSGDSVSISHIWNAKGSFQVKVKAIDDPNSDGDLSDGEESVWSDPLSISMPRVKTTMFFSNLLDKFPLFKQIFFYLFN